jgi:hypothetical protein
VQALREGEPQMGDIKVATIIAGVKHIVISIFLSSCIGFRGWFYWLQRLV